MIPVYTFQEIENFLLNESRFSKQVKLVGILFSQPETQLSKVEIIPHLEYFHHRSGNAVHFFCGGYGAYLPPDEYPDKIPVTKISRAQWYFSSNLFNQLRGEIEKRTTWHYSGGTDILIFDIKKLRGNKEVVIKDVALFSLEEMKHNGIIHSVREFFEEIFRFAENYEGESAIKDFVNPPFTGNNLLISHNIRILFKRMGDAWRRQDFGAVLHASASIFETMAKDIVNNPSVENQTLGSFFEQYRKHSSLSPQSLDLIIQTYKQRNETALAGHGGTRPPDISREQARDLMKITNDLVRNEYKDRVIWVVDDNLAMTNLH